MKAEGDLSNAELIVTQDFFTPLADRPLMSIGSNLQIFASGMTSKAKASFASGSNPIQQINGALLVNATGKDAQANFQTQFFDGKFSAHQLQSIAMGVGSQADINIELGRFIFFGGPVGVRGGGGDISVAGDVLLRSGAVNAASAISLRTLNGDIKIGGNVDISAYFGNAASTASGAKITMNAGAGRMVNTGGSTSPDYSAITGYGAVNITGDLHATSAGYGAATELDIFSVGRAFTVGGNINLVAAGTRSSITTVFVTHSGPDFITPTLITRADIQLSGAVLLEASGAGAVANFSVLTDQGDIHLGRGMSVIASGVDAHATQSISSPNGEIHIAGDLICAATAVGSTSSLTIDATASPISIQGGVSLLATGAGSDASLKLETTTAAINISGSVAVGALGEASHAGLFLHQGTSNTTSINGTILLNADSGIASAAGALVSADLQIGKLGDAPIDIFLDAIQQDDAATMSLKLFTDGGKAQLGNEGHAGLTTLSLGEKSSTTNQLLDAIDISFSGTLGKAVVEFGVDQDSTTEAAIQRVLIKGFRLGQDELHFEGLAGVSTTARTLDSFVNFAMNHFNTGIATGTPSTQFTVADVLVGGNESTTYLAYDHDGTGISAIITLEGVSASAYKTANGLA